jgi:hypothetical protein
MKLYSDRDRKVDHDLEVVACGQELLARLDFSRQMRGDGYRLREIIKSCLIGNKGTDTAIDICQKLKLALSKYETYAFQHLDLLRGLLEVQPIATLDVLLDDSAETRKMGVGIFQESHDDEYNPLDVVKLEDLVHWCRINPQKRYPIAASVISMFVRVGETSPLEWTPVALKILDNASNRVEVLARFAARLQPTSWSGSRAAIMEANIKLFENLAMYVEDDPSCLAFIEREKEKLETEVESERDFESSQNRDRDERFE